MTPPILLLQPPIHFGASIGKLTLDAGASLPSPDFPPDFQNGEEWFIILLFVSIRIFQILLGCPASRDFLTAGYS